MNDFAISVRAAYKLIQPYILQTPLIPSALLSQETGAKVFLKCENTQYTHSFKTRGALYKLLSLSEQERQQGIVTASSGNHGAAIAFGLKTLQIPGTIFVPQQTSRAKIENIRQYHAALEFYGDDCMLTELYAREYATAHAKIYISPYNDRQVIMGQGTVALEMLQQLAKIDVVLVAVGGGGLISGIAGFFNAVSPQTQVIGCLPENSPVMAASIQAGKILKMATQPTLSDATAGGMEPDSITFAMCQQWVTDYILVSEAEIKAAMLTLINTERLLVEGAAGVALAALRKNRARFRHQNVVVILSGGNISIETLKKVLD